MRRQPSRNRRGAEQAEQPRPSRRGRRPRPQQSAQADRRKCRRHVGQPCPRSVRASPRAPSPAGSSRSATRSRPTSRCWRSPPTRSTPRSPRRLPGRCSRSRSPRTRPSRWAPSSRSSAPPTALPQDQRCASRARRRPRPRRRRQLRQRPTRSRRRSPSRTRRPLPAGGPGASTAAPAATPRPPAALRPPRHCSQRRRVAVRHATRSQAGRRAQCRPRTLSGTGVGGRIRKQDVLAAAEQARKAAEAIRARSARQHRPPQPGSRQLRPPLRRRQLRGTTEKMSRMRAVIARRMVESLQMSGAAHDRRRGRRHRDRPAAPAGQGRLRGPRGREAVVPAVLREGHGRGAQGASEAQRHDRHGEERGHLLSTPSTSASRSTPSAACSCPVIRDAGDLNIAGLARKIADLAERTRSNKISPDELSGGTFTLTNTGSRGALFDTPIINQPQVGILGTGAVVKRPRSSSRTTSEPTASRSARWSSSRSPTTTGWSTAPTPPGSSTTIKQRLEAWPIRGRPRHLTTPGVVRSCGSPSPVPAV